MIKLIQAKLPLIFYGKKVKTIETFLDYLMLDYPSIIGFEQSKKKVPVNPWFVGPSYIYYVFFENSDHAKEFSKDEYALKSYYSFLGLEKKTKKEKRDPA